MRNHGIGAAVLTALVFLCIRHDLAPPLRGPAPYPPEWQWRHRARSLARAAPAVPIAVALAGLLAWSGGAGARRRPRRSAAIVVAGGLGLGGLFPLALLESEDGGATAHLVRRTASPGYLSYHAVAVSPAARDVRRFLREYPRLLPTLPMHAATHPPGPVLFFRAWIAAAEAWPAVARALDDRVLAACGAGGDGCGPHVAALRPPERAAALAGPLMVHALAVAALVPLAWLAFQLTRDPLAAARAAALWPLVPGAALFVPAVDAGLALPITASLAGLRAAIAGDRGSSRAAGTLLAGAAGAAALYVSYGSALFLALGAAAVIASLPAATLAYGRAHMARAVAASAAIGLAFAAVPALLAHDPVESARTAVHVHSQTYTARRSYALWLLFGPLDFAVFLGAPVALGLLAHVAHVARTRRPGVVSAALSPPARLTLAVAAGLALLVASGLVRGEMGRLLAPLMPLALLAGVLRLEDEPRPRAHDAAVLAVLLAVLDVALRLNWRI